MSAGAVARRYAEAVFEIGVEKHDVDTWLQDLRTIAEYFGNRRLQFVLSEPNISFERKRQIVSDLLQSKVSHDALGLALLLVERGLVNQTGRILDQYTQRYNDYHNQAVATVTTAMPLDDATRDEVRRQLERQTGKKIILEEKIDPSILGGVIARVGDLLIDSSVRYRLSKLRQQIIQGGGSFGGSSDGRGPEPSGPAGGPGGGAGTGGIGGVGGPGGEPIAQPPAAMGYQPPTPPSGGSSSMPGGSAAGSASFSTGARSPQASAHQAPRDQGQPTAVVNVPPSGQRAAQPGGGRPGDSGQRGQFDRRNPNRRGKGRRR